MKKNNKLILLIAIYVLFIINTILVVSNNSSSIDASFHNIVFLLFSEMTTKIAKIFTFFGSTVFIVCLSIVLFIIFMLKKKKNYAISIASMIISSTILNNVIKFIIRRPRPEYMMVNENTYSYPSGHTMASVTLYGFLIYLVLNSNLEKKYKILYSIILGMFTLLVPLSRIYLGAHYLTDVCGGALLSISLIVLFSIINQKEKILD